MGGLRALGRSNQCHTLWRALQADRILLSEDDSTYKTVLYTDAACMRPRPGVKSVLLKVRGQVRPVEGVGSSPSC